MAYFLATVHVTKIVEANTQAEAEETMRRRLNRPDIRVNLKTLRNVQEADKALSEYGT